MNEHCNLKKQDFIQLLTVPVCVFRSLHQGTTKEIRNFCFDLSFYKLEPLPKLSQKSYPAHNIIPGPSCVSKTPNMRMNHKISG